VTPFTRAAILAIHFVCSPPSPTIDYPVEARERREGEEGRGGEESKEYSGEESTVTRSEKGRQ